jgi:hypothetical protein
MLRLCEKDDCQQRMDEFSGWMCWLGRDQRRRVVGEWSRKPGCGHTCGFALEGCRAVAAWR